MKKKSRNTIYQFVAFVALLSVSFSCSDNFYKEEVGNRITPSENYNSQDDLYVTMFGAIKPLQIAMKNLVLYDGLRTDMMDVTPSADIYLRELNNQDFSTNNPYLDFSDFYKSIISANEILANIDKVAKIDPSFNDYILFSRKGDLIALRAWCYFNFVKIYGKAALIDDNMATLPTKELVYLDKDVMVDTLINQLIPYLYTDLTKIEVGGYYLNTRALLGELYLEKGDYANAVKYLKEGLESYGNPSGLYKVDRSFLKEGWVKLFVNASNNGSEVISAIPFNSVKGQSNPLTGLMLYSDKYMVKPTKVLVDSYKAQVTLKNEAGDIYRGKGVTYDTLPGSNDEYYISKYSLDAGDKYSSDIIAIRAGDVHLLLAEALNRMGDTTTALVLLNRGFSSVKPRPPAEYIKWTGNLGIRGRAYIQPKSVPAGTDPAAVTEYVEDLIIQERAMELAYEGRRWFDLMRIANRRNDPNYLASRVAAKFDSDPAKAEEIRTKLLNKENWYIPLK
jgi:tetratricopeptide (TPR) repeat protein